MTRGGIYSGSPDEEEDGDDWTRVIITGAHPALHVQWGTVVHVGDVVVVYTPVVVGAAEVVDIEHLRPGGPDALRITHRIR